LIANVDGVPVAEHPLAPYLIDAGFVRGAMGFQAARPRGAYPAVST
jgi:hypothetical protein